MIIVSNINEMCYSSEERKTVLAEKIRAVSDEPFEVGTVIRHRWGHLGASLNDHGYKMDSWSN